MAYQPWRCLWITIRRGFVKGDWQQARTRFSNYAYGLTHDTCRECGTWKGYSCRHLCERCIEMTSVRLALAIGNVLKLTQPCGE